MHYSLKVQLDKLVKICDFLSFQTLHCNAMTRSKKLKRDAELLLKFAIVTAKKTLFSLSYVNG